MDQDFNLSKKKRRDPRKIHFKLRNDLRARVFALGLPCGICGREIDYTLPAGTPMSPELDEIIPVSRGGSPYDFDNLQPAHRECNQRKGNRMASDKISSQINPLPHSRSW